MTAKEVLSVGRRPVSYYVDLYKGLLECPHDMVAGFPRVSDLIVIQVEAILFMI